MYDDQEKIKLRELIPHKGLVPEAIPSKLFLDMVPSYSTDVTRAMRGEAKRLSRNYLRQNGGKCRRSFYMF